MTGSLLSEGLVEADESDRAIGWGCSEAVGWSSVSSAMTVYISSMFRADDRVGEPQMSSLVAQAD